SRTRASLLGFLRAARHADDLPEHFACGLGWQPGVARALGHTANHRGFARRVENRESRGTLELSRAFTEREPLREQRDDLIVDALDLVAALRELRQRFGFRWIAHATALGAPVTSSSRPAARANAPSCAIICVNA